MGCGEGPEGCDERGAAYLRAQIEQREHNKRVRVSWRLHAAHSAPRHQKRDSKVREEFLIK